MNVCGACGLDFAAVDDFDSHRVGVHGYTFWEGQRMESPRADGRRCLARQEMIEDGWGQNVNGRWTTPARLRRQARAGAIFAPRRVRTAKAGVG